MSIVEIMLKSGDPNGSSFLLLKIRLKGGANREVISQTKGVLRLLH